MKSMKTIENCFTHNSIPNKDLAKLVCSSQKTGNQQRMRYLKKDDPFIKGSREILSPKYICSNGLLHDHSVNSKYEV